MRCIIQIGNIVSDILVKNRKLLTLIIHGTDAPLYTNKIYPTPYIPHTCQIRHMVGNKFIG